jgi:hypothetical protein
MGATKHGFRWGILALQGAAFAIAILVVVFKVRVSPGELTTVHAREHALEGSNGCKECHGESRQAAIASSCATCHVEIQKELTAKSGFHGTLALDLAPDCGRCHLEHKGKDFPPVNRQSFTFAGVDDPMLYVHEGLGYHLTGKHDGLQCARCHLQADVRILEKGRKRFLGLEQTCTTCHKDVHEGTFGPNCQSCHGQDQPFKAVAGFRHTDSFPLVGGHAGLACVACHKAGSAEAISALAGPSRVESTEVPVRACIACHRSPHGEEFLGNVAKPLGLSPTQTCVRCHTAEQKTFLGPHATLSKQQHAAVGFPLTAPHHKVTCTACHADYGTSVSGDPVDAYHRRYPGRSPDNCRACHGDPHRGEFEIGVWKGKDCLSCHSRQAFAPPEFDAAKHDAVFHLEGRHRKIHCDQCHPKTTPEGPRDYRGVPQGCISCHKDPHGGQFDKPIYLGNDCRVCHTQSSWKPPTYTVGMHAKTAFALTGAHLGIACTQCHKVPEPDRSKAAATSCPRTFAGVASKCSACHKDVHAGKFDGTGRPAVVAGQRDCARCHGTDSFRALQSKTFDHPLWTGYALNGAHAKLECAACHGRSVVPNAQGRSLGLAAGTRCQSCHADPHVGQFGPTATVNCAQCHKEEPTFRDIVFDHQKDSRFPLDEVHVKVACAKCHKPLPVAGETTAIRYKPLGVKCGDCHDPRGVK